jgi:hypothetical protein
MLKLKVSYSRRSDSEMTYTAVGLVLMRLTGRSYYALLTLRSSLKAPLTKYVSWCEHYRGDQGRETIYAQRRRGSMEEQAVVPA